MKTFLTFTFALLLVLPSMAQQSRKSPAEETKTTLKNGTEVTINYSSPRVKGRKIWGSLVPYNKIWRTGANEATTITFSKDVSINNQAVKAGTYALFTIPGTDDWKIILNSVAKQWGAYDYDESKDVLRFTTEPTELKSSTENLTFTVSSEGLVSMTWEKLTVSFSVH